jgi:hypothetical protein
VGIADTLAANILFFARRVNRNPLIASQNSGTAHAAEGFAMKEGGLLVYGVALEAVLILQEIASTVPPYIPFIPIVELPGFPVVQAAFGT